MSINVTGYTNFGKCGGNDFGYIYFIHDNIECRIGWSSNYGIFPVSDIITISTDDILELEKFALDNKLFVKQRQMVK